jgi:hypothetical protein
MDNPVIVGAFALHRKVSRTLAGFRRKSSARSR